MMKRNLRWFVTIGILLVSGSSFAGANSSGGGTLFSRDKNAQPILLDFVFVNPAFEDTFNIYPRPPLDLSDFSKTIGFDDLKIKEQAIYSFVTERLNAWRKSSPLVVEVIEWAIEGMDWFYTPHRVALRPDYELPENLSQQYPDFEIKAAALYTGQYGTWISAPTWNNLGDYTQAGLIIHEASRHIQKTYHFLVSDKAVQKLTATIMLTDPQEWQTLETAEFVDGELLKMVQKHEQFVEEKKKLQTELCQELENIRIEEDADLESRLNELRTLACKDKLFDTLSLSKVHDILRMNNVAFGTYGEESKELRETLRNLSSRARDLMWSEIACKMDRNTFKYIDVARSLENFKFRLGMGWIREYLNENPLESIGKDIGRRVVQIFTLGFVDTEPGRSEMAELVEMLREYNERLLEEGALIE